MSPLGGASGPLLARTGARAYVFALALVALVAAFLPLADHLGYEFSELIALAAGLFGAAPGVSAARREREKERSGQPASGDRKSVV